VANKLFGRSPAGRAIRSNLFFVPQKSISTTIPNAKQQNQNHLMNQKNHSAGNIPQLRFPEFVGEWEKKKLGEVADITTGSTPSTFISEYYNGSKLFVSPADLQGNRYVINTKTTLTELGFSKGRKITKGSVLFVCIGSTIGKVSIANEECLTNQQINSLNAKTGFENDFIFTLLEYNGCEIKLLAGIQAVPQINKTDFSNISFSFPTLPEQTRIANFLTAVDEKIQALKKKKGLLEAYKKGVMQRLFSQGEKLSEAGLSGLKDEQDFDANNPKILKSSKSRFRQEDGSNFPDWEVKKLGEVLIKNSTKNKGQKYSLVQSVSNKFGFINQDELFEDRRVASKDTSNYYVIEKGHFAYNPSRIDVGSLAYKIDNETSVISPLYISFKANSIYLKDDYLLNWFSTVEFTKQMNSSFEGSVRNTLSYESLVRMNISLPSLPEQTRIANFLSAIDDKIKHNNTQIQKMEVWKKGLLQKMFV
jgi:type I restriction enzyme S subunit